MPSVIVLTDGTASHPNSRSHPAAKLRRLREAESRAGMNLLGAGPGAIGFMGLPDADCPIAGPAFDAVVTAIAALAMRMGAGTILANWPFDGDPDHEAAHAIAQAAARESGAAHLSYTTVLPGEAPLPYSGAMRTEIDVSAYMPQKQAAIAAHRSQYADIITDDAAARQWPRPMPALPPFETLLCGQA
jgi:LmbE family N-acetylglucosaminyl deacetylase